MLLTIGSKPAGGDVVDLLLECHGRIRSFAALAVRLASAGPAPAAQVAESAQAIHRYFREALPLHVEDEEQSLAPRLRGLATDVDRALAGMTAQHREHTAYLEELLHLCSELGAQPGRHPVLARPLTTVAARLTADFERHLAQEEAVIFPALRSCLAPEVLTLILGEVRGRRTGHPVSLGPGRRQG